MQRHLTLLRKLMLPSCQGECFVVEDVEVLFSFNCSGESSDTLATHVSVTHYVVSFSSERWKYKLETAKARAQDCVTVYITFLYNDILLPITWLRGNPLHAGNTLQEVVEHHQGPCAS